VSANLVVDTEISEKHLAEVGARSRLDHLGRRHGPGREHGYGPSLLVTIVTRIRTNDSNPARVSRG